jgi:hypothetical protein
MLAGKYIRLLSSFWTILIVVHVAVTTGTHEASHCAPETSQNNALNLLNYLKTTVVAAGMPHLTNSSTNSLHSVDE